MLVGRLNPVARTSFWKRLVLLTVTGMGADRPVLPAASRALAVRVWVPLSSVRVSQERP